MTSTNTYVVYHITYFGDKLPAKSDSNITPSNYIGSTSLDKINNGYLGSVTSKKYKSIWKSETKNNPHLFKLEIISYHDTRQDATYKELQIQKIFNVVTNPLFVNMAYASVNGYFGMPIVGNKHSAETRAKISESHKNQSPEQRESRHKKISESHVGKKLSNETKAKVSASLIGNTRAKGFSHSIETKAKVSSSLIGHTRCKGFVQSAETKAKRLESHNARTPEQKKASQLKRLATRAKNKSLKNN